MMIEYAKRELSKIPHDAEGMQDFMDKNILQIIEIFMDQGHTNHSAYYALSILERLLRFLPITPLTGEEDEWRELPHGGYQNIRCSRVFKDTNGRAYDIEGKIFTHDGGKSWFTNSNSLVSIEFPYVPPTHPEKVYLEEEG